MNYKIKTYNNCVINNKLLIKEFLLEYINNCPIDDVIKNEILDDKFLAENPGYYIDYPYLFSSAFQIKDNSILKPLSIAGFLYYKSTLLIDRILDSSYPIFKVLPLLTVCQEECIKILSSLFPLDSPYWSYWNRRKVEFYNAFIIDTKTHAVSSYEDFEHLSDWKSALGKLAIDALYLLSKKENSNLYSSLLNAHCYFYCAFQILDDIADFREDLKYNQFNIGLWVLKREMLTEEIKNQDIDTLAKHLHVYGYSVQLLELALEYLNKVFEITDQFELQYWKTEAIKLWNTAVIQILNIKGYIKTIYIKEQLSNSLINKNNLKNAYQNGLSFLFSMQNIDGSWNEYCNNAGASDVWSTSFIVSFLNEMNLSDNEIEKLSGALTFITDNKYSNLWGYNKEWIEDIDSSVFALLSLPTGEMKDDFLYLIDKQKEDGGFSTYFDEKALESALFNHGNKESDLRGWLQSHLCVSSSTLYLMTKKHYKGEEYYKLIDYIKKNYSSEYLWTPYWWSDIIYCIYFLTKASVSINDEELIHLISISIDNIVSRQKDNGSFENNVFYSSLMISTLCVKEEFYKKYIKNIEPCINWLLRNQYSDGSWASSYAMIMPGTNILYPVDADNWQVSTRGVNIKADDFSRLFSTVTAINAVDNYANRIHK